MANKRSISSRYASISRQLSQIERVVELTQLQKATIREIRSLLLSEKPEDISPEDNFKESPALDRAEQLMRERLPRPKSGAGSAGGDGGQTGGGSASSDPSSDIRDVVDRFRKGRKEPNRQRSRAKTEKTSSGQAKPSGQAKGAGSQPKVQPGATTNTAVRTAGTAETQAAAQAATKVAVAAEGRVTAGAAARFVLLKNPWVVGISVALLLIILLLITSATGKNKLISGIGGSVLRPLDYEKQEDRDLVEKIHGLVEEKDPVIEVVPPADPKDLWEWREENGQKVNAMDKRILQTLAYMVDHGWNKIVIGILKTGGPDGTRRQKLNSENKVNLDAASAYSSGQAMGIVGLGKTSPGLTACMGLKNSVPVQIAWQEAMTDNRVRPIYEQLQVDMTALAISLKGDLVSSGLKEYSSGPDGGEYSGLMGGKTPLNEKSVAYLSKVKENLSRLQGIFKDNASAATPAKRYLTDALSAFDAVDLTDIDGSQTSLRRGVNMVFRMMQVANMAGWEGSKKDGCRLWKAYEARQNIRKLVLQVMQMPVTGSGKDAVFDTGLVVKQMIVFSPEDDLDNGLPDQDVFPSGAKAVDVGGISYDTTGKDNKVDEADNHFVALPMDNGIVSKLSTVFLGGGSEVPAAGGATGSDEGEAQGEEDKLWDGGYLSAGRQSYKKFIHIGF